MLIYANFDKFVENVSWVFTMGLVTSSILDFTTTSCLLWYLGKARTGFAGMDQIVNTLSLYAVENGLITSIAVVISLGFWLGMRHNLVFMAIHFVVAKLYANSLLATLNNRQQLRSRRGNSVSEVPQLVFNLRQTPTLKRPMEPMGGVRINVEKSVMEDEETAIGMSPIKSRGMEKGSAGTSLTSGAGTVVEDLRGR